MSISYLGLLNTISADKSNKNFFERMTTAAVIVAVNMCPVA